MSVVFVFVVMSKYRQYTALLGFRNVLKGPKGYSYLALTPGFPGPCGKSNLGYMALSKYAGCLQCHGTLRRKDTPPCQAAHVSVPGDGSALPCGASECQQRDLSRFCRWLLCYCMIHPSNLKVQVLNRAKKQTPKEHASLPPQVALESSLAIFLGWC